jgi:LacI family transcriptional regulator
VERGRPTQTTTRDKPKAHKPASIYDVAKHADVSIKTVSRVLNHQPNVSQSARDRVMAAVRELSYRPNLFARGLASERSFLIGLLYDNPSAGYMASIQLGALARCREEGYHLIVEQLNAQDPNLEDAVTSLVLQSSLHGVILTPPLCDSAAVLDALTAAQIPFVRIAPQRPLPGTPSVSMDDQQAAHDMTAYLIGLGHRRIGFIKGHPDHGATYARFEGYRAAMKEAGLPVSDEIIVQGHFSYQSGMEAGLLLLSLKHRPTAIFASNDDMAAATISVAHRMGLNVPDDVSIVGFDDTALATSVWPELTTVKQPISAMAEAALELLIADLRSHLPGAPRKLTERVLSHAMIIRESSGPPAAGRRAKKSKSVRTA